MTLIKNDSSRNRPLENKIIINIITSHVFVGLTVSPVHINSIVTLQ
jgi:hypothetical protein